MTLAPRASTLAGLIGLSLSAASLPALADTFTVTSTADSGAGSLRSAIDAANAASGNIHSIVFSLPAGSEISVASELPAITKAGLSIGSVSGPRVLLRATANNPMLRVGATNTLLTLNNLVMADGRRVGGGGCLLAEPPSGNGSLVLNQVAMGACLGLRNDLFRSAQGGALLVFGRDVNINDSVFEFNGFAQAAAGQEFNVAGGAVALIGDSARRLLIDGALFELNQANGGATASQPVAVGGSIYVGGGARLQIDRANLSESYAFGQAAGADARGGAIYAEGTVFIEDSLFFQGGSARGLITVESDDRTRTLELRNTSFNEVEAFSDAVLRSNLASVTLRNSGFSETRDGRAEGSELRVDALPGQATPSLLRLSNTLFARSPQGANAACSVGTNVTVENSFNLSDHAAPGCGIRSTTLPLNLDGFDQPSDRFGGWLLVRGSSRVIDFGNPATPLLADWSTCATRDARGVTRPIDATSPGIIAVCDVGPVEYERVIVFADGFESP
jgi:hypothetical protein